MYGDGCNDATLEYLKDLPQLQNLALWAWAAPPSDGPTGGTSVRGVLAGITDDGLQVVASCKQLKQISLMGNQVSDLGLEHLHHHPTLRDVQIGIDSSRATHKGIDALMSTLRDAHYQP